MDFDPFFEHKLFGAVVLLVALALIIGASIGVIIP